MDLRTSLSMLLGSKELQNKDVILSIKRPTETQIIYWRIKGNEDFRRQMSVIQMEAEKMIPQFLDCEVIQEEHLDNRTEFPAVYIIHVNT